MTAKPICRVQRVLVALDASPGSRAAAAAAARIAAALDTDLEGLFVEDAALVRLAEAPHAQQLGLHTDRAWRVSGPLIERQLRAQATRARRALAAVAEREGVTATFRRSRGVVAAELLAASGAEDLVIVGRVGWSHGLPRRLGSTARAFLERRPGLVLVLAPGARVAPPPGVLVDGSAEADKALRLASQLARAVAGGLVVLATDGQARERASELLGAESRFARFAETDGTAGALGAAVAASRIGLLILPVGPHQSACERISNLPADLRCPVLVVR